MTLSEGLFLALIVFAAVCIWGVYDKRKDEDDYQNFRKHRRDYE